MAELKADVLVLGAGMVGVSAALHLQKRGRDVVLIDRHELAGEETSYGNGGLIECASVFPYMFPRDFGQILRYAFNRAPQVRYHFTDLPAFLPWLVRYFLASSPERALHSAMAELPLIQRSLIEHEALIAEAECAGAVAADRLDQAVSLRGDACERGAGSGARQAIWRRGRDAGHGGDRGARAASDRRFQPARSIFPRPASCRIPAGWPRPMRRCSAARAGAISSATRERSNNPAGGGGWRRWKARSPRARSWWRWGRGPIRSSRRSAIRSRFRSSAATICI